MQLSVQFHCLLGASGLQRVDRDLPISEGGSAYASHLQRNWLLCVDPETSTCSHFTLPGRAWMAWGQSGAHPIRGETLVGFASYTSFPLGASRIGEGLHRASGRGRKGLHAVRSWVGMMPLRSIPGKNVHTLGNGCIKPVSPVLHVALIRLLCGLRSR